MTTSVIPISLVGTQTILSSVTTTPTNILGNPLNSGRYFLAFINGNNSTFLGNIDVTVTQNSTQVNNMSPAWYLTDTSNTSWNLSTGDDIVFTLSYSSSLMYISASSTYSNLVIRQIVVPYSYIGTNTYGIDNLQAANTAANSPITMKSPLIFTPVSSNAINLGQATVTQTTSITTGVTINSASGMITTVSATTTAGSTSTFTVTNSAVSSTSIVLATLCGYSGTTLLPGVSVSNISSGSFDINITNYNGLLGAALNGTLTISFLCC